MRWVRLVEDRLDPLMRFLGPLEAGCISFTEKLLQDRHLTVPSRREYNVLVREESDGSVSGAILQDLNGLFYPVLAPTAGRVEPEAVIKMLRVSRKLFSIMGRSEDVTALENAMPRPPTQWLDYHLMVQSVPPPELPLPRLPRGLVIRMAREDEARHLFDIQKKYEIEEVLLPGNTFSASATIRHLKQTLREQIVLVAELDGIAVAKANTNARGVFYDQIGGVFTEKALRSRGVGTALMLRLCELVAKDHKSATLFVKEENGPAQKMYRNIGFAIESGFRISYYR